MTQGELEKIPFLIGHIFSDLEIRIMSDIVRRIKINGFSTASVDWQMTRLQQLGKSEEDVKAWIQTALDASGEEIENIFSDTIYKQYIGHERTYKVNGFKQIPYKDNIPLKQLVEATKRQISQEYENLANSMGFAIKSPSGQIIHAPLPEYYRTTLDNAIMDIQNGAFSYQAVLEKTINQMTASGIRSVDYESGWHNRTDVAARRAVMTGFRQVQGYINEQVASELGVNSYEVSWHRGARPTHQVWQGRVYTMQQLKDICGLGSVTGLHGAHCYHDYTVFIPGVSARTYTDEWLDEQNRVENIPKTYLGKEYTTYEALQQQRKMETGMRKYRQDIKLLQEGDSADKAIILKKARYQGKMQEYEAFSKTMNLPMKKERIYQDGLRGRFIPTKTEQAKLAAIAQTKAESIAIKTRRSKFSDRFSEYNNGQKDTITTRRLLNNLNKSEIGKETISYISEHPELSIKMCYEIDHPREVWGEQFGDEIWIYASDTKTVQKTAEVLIHEVTHHRYDIGGSQWAECVCFAQEMKHKTGRTKLTGSELRDIIKIVKELYPEYSWR